jgi:hypothetical protein
MAVTMPPLHVNHTVTFSIKTKDWNPTALPMVGFALRCGNDSYATGVAAANSDGQTVTVTLTVPQVHHQGGGPWPCELRIAYCTGVQPNGHFGLPQMPEPIATGQVFFP